VTDGIITGTMSGANSGAGACGSLLDALYIFATNTTTTANLNLCGTSYGLTQNGSVSFSADHGYTGDGSTGYFGTGFIANSATTPNYVLNSGSIGAYDLTSRTTSATMALMGGGASFQTYIIPFDTNNIVALNDSAGNNVTAPANAKGLWMLSRTAVSTEVEYHNGTSYASLSPTSSSVPDNEMFILARRGAAPASFSTDQESSAFIGAGLTSGQVTAISNRINAYMTALGINVY
jgi:hypothetical protein